MGLGKGGMRRGLEWRNGGLHSPMLAMALAILSAEKVVVDSVAIASMLRRSCGCLSLGYACDLLNGSKDRM